MSNPLLQWANEIDTLVNTVIENDNLESHQAFQEKAKQIPWNDVIQALRGIHKQQAEMLTLVLTVIPFSRWNKECEGKSFVEVLKLTIEEARKQGVAPPEKTAEPN